MNANFRFPVCISLILLSAAPVHGQAARKPRPSTPAAAKTQAAAAPNDPLQRGLTDVAQNLKKLLAGRGEQGIAVGQFTGPPNFPTSGGPGIVKALSEELGRSGVDVKVRANLGVTGTYRAIGEKAGVSLQGGPKVVVPGLDFEVTMLVIKAQVEDASGKRLVDYEQKINDPNTISRIFGLTFESPPGNPAKPIEESIAKPSVHVDGSRIRASAKSPYGIELLVRPAGGKERQPREARVEDGLAFVNIEREEVYAVRLINDSPHEAAVALSVDGLSMFAFSDEKTARFMVVPPGESYVVVGWHRNFDEFNEFLITSYAKGAAALLGADPANVGTITATFQACWPKGTNPPPDEPGSAPIAGGFTTSRVPEKSTGVGKAVQSRSTRSRARGRRDPLRRERSLCEVASGRCRPSQQEGTEETENSSRLCFLLLPSVQKE